MTEMKLSEICRVLGCGETLPDRVITGISTDSRSVQKSELFIPLKGERFDAHDFLPDLVGRCAAALTERDTKVEGLDTLRVDSTLKALGRLGTYHAERAALSFTVSLTGSVGKTTTKELTALVLSCRYKTRRTEGNLNNHIGVPKTLLSLAEGDEALVCEMGMSARHEIEYLASLLRSDVAVITNVGHSHIENLGSRENIASAKLEILTGLKEGGTLVINGDEPLLLNNSWNGRVVRVGRDKSCEVWCDCIETDACGIRFDASVFGKKVKVALPAFGAHNAVNAIFALAVGHLAGVSVEEAVSALKGYVPVGMRQRIYEKGSALVIADCYNAGVESMTGAISTLKDVAGERESVAVLGDMLELGAASESLHRRVGRAAADEGIDAVIAAGDAARYIAEEAERCGVRTYYFAERDSAAELVRSFAEKGAALLFKASRGMAFERLISAAGLDSDSKES